MTSYPRIPRNPDVFEIEEPENLDGIEEPLDFDVDVDAVEAIAEEEIDEFSEPGSRVL